jgi:LuxR family maltose regulon positive regulatory protein
MAMRAVGLAEQGGNWHVWAFMMGLHARIQAAQGHLRQAAETYRREIAGRPASRPWLGSGIAESGLAALHYEWNDLAQAADYARTGLKYSELTGHAEVQMSCHRLMARIHQAQGDGAAAWEALAQSAEAVRRGNLSPMMADRVAAERGQVALAQGDIAAAAAWLGQVQGQYGAAFHYPHLPLERAMLLLAQDDRAAAAGLLAERFEVAAQDHVRYAQVEIRILQALAAGDDRQALAYLADALTWAEPEGYIRTFVDRGPALVPLLQGAGQRGIAAAYVSKLLAAFGEPNTTSVSKSLTPNTQYPMVEPLSERELEVLRLLAAGCSNQEIADRLILAVGTVKKHLNNIFGKLGVESRTQCVARARELKLL